MTKGLSTKGLARLHEVMADHVERGAMPGLITLVARHGDVHIDVIGAQAFGHPEPMERDSIFRIASLTKPIAAVAAMTLVEEGTLHLGAPVDDLLPELADRQVLRSLDADLDDTVPANRPITLDDLLTFRLGFGCIMAPPDTYPIQTAEAELQLRSLGPPWPPTPHSPDAWIQRLGTLPLMYQPGEQWLYNTGAQVLGILLERAAGKPLEALLTERIFEPLGMRDTAFSVSAGQRYRFTTAYVPDPESGVLSVLDDADGSFWARPPAFPDAAGWLVGTIDDFWSFAQMLEHGGRSGNGRIITESSVELVTTDHLDQQQRASASMFLGGQGWGLGLSAPAADGTRGALPGGYGWEGGTGTTWRSDADHGLTGILFTQRSLNSPEPPEAFVDFWDSAYQALED
jgi:CubicO group peptidase (beta-lactamase class C family)